MNEIFKLVEDLINVEKESDKCEKCLEGHPFCVNHHFEFWNKYKRLKKEFENRNKPAKIATRISNYVNEGNKILNELEKGEDE